MSYMDVCHQETLRSDNSFVFVHRTAVDRNGLPDSGVVADFSSCFFTSEFQILRDAGYHGSGENPAISTDACTVHYRCVGADPGSIADNHIFLNGGEGLYGNIVTNFSFGVNIC